MRKRLRNPGPPAAPSLACARDTRNGRDALSQVVRRGPLGVLYCTVSSLALVAVITVLLLGSELQRIVIGYVAFGIFVALTATQYLKARRVRRAAQRSPLWLSPLAGPDLEQPLLPAPS